VVVRVGGRLVGGVGSLAVGQLRHRPGRAVALGAGILVAAVSFVLLASSARSSELRVRGTIAENFRSAYDILVRPRGSFSTLERQQGLVRDNYLSGIYGGISFGQYQAIRRLRGVAVAAPIANVGFVMPEAFIPISLGRIVNRTPVQLFRLRLSWVADDGLSRYSSGAQYVYVTRRDRMLGCLSVACGGPDSPIELASGGRHLRVCDAFGLSEPRASGPFDTRQSASLSCFSTRSPGSGPANWVASGIPRPYPRGPGTIVSTYLPISVAAIDPHAEAQLVGLNDAMVSGRYLREDDSTRLVHRPGGYLLPEIPLIASDQLYVGDRLRVTVERLTPPRPTAVPAILASSGCHDHPTRGECLFVPSAPPDPASTTAYPFLSRLHGDTVESMSVSLGRVYQHVLGQLQDSTYWTTSPVRYRTIGTSTVEPLAGPHQAATDWVLPSFDQVNGGYYPVAPDNLDTQYRRIHQQVATNRYHANIADAPSLRTVGRFDPHKLRGFSALSQVPMETYYPPQLTAGDARSSRLLHGRPLLPSQNVGGYIQQPPLLLTTLSGLRGFLNTDAFSSISRRELAAPISVIRIRVANVHGDDPLSRARIRLVAQEIHDTTGLAVDITAGSSPAPITVDLPAGKYGRPALTLREGWTKKGVAVSYLNAVDRKSLLLFGLILVVCALFLTNGALAATKARRTEIGTLQTIGWSRWDVSRAILAELVVVGALAGVAGTIVAIILVSAAGLSMPLLEAGLVFPIAVMLAAGAGLVPAWRATRLSPVEALAPPVIAAGHTHRVGSINAMAFVNLLRVPLRTLLGCMGLAIGIAAAALLIGIQDAFQGQLVSSVLGQAITVQVRGADELSVAFTVVLAGCSLADVLYLNLRERSAELATLRTCGWSLNNIRRLIATEALGLALMAAVAGMLISIAIGAVLLGLPIHALLVGAFAAALAGVAIAQVASLVPLARADRLAPATILAEE
jgi:putative ABC transport system permease protein